jgi:hypothetical protein
VVKEEGIMDMNVINDTQMEFPSPTGASQDAPETEPYSQEQTQPGLLSKPTELGGDKIPESSQGIGNKTGMLSGEFTKTTRVWEEGSDGLSERLAGKRGAAQMSPHWEELEDDSAEIERNGKETDSQEEVMGEGKAQLDPMMAICGTNHRKKSSTPEQGAIGQSQRVKEQGPGAINIAEKATLAAQKRNLEGNYLNLKNSFAVLSNTDLMSRSKKMGVKIGEGDLQKFDILKELEVVRDNLNRKLSNIEDKEKEDSEEMLPLEEMKYLDWKSNSSKEEDLQTMTSRMKKRNKKRLHKRKEQSGGGRGHPSDESTPPDRGVLRSCSKYNLRKGAAWQKG